MGNIQTYSLTNTVFVTHVKKPSFECAIHHRPEARQVKVACDVPHLYQFIPNQACLVKFCKLSKKQKLHSCKMVFRTELALCIVTVTAQAQKTQVKDMLKKYSRWNKSSNSSHFQGKSLYQGFDTQCWDRVPTQHPQLQEFHHFVMLKGQRMPIINSCYSLMGQLILRAPTSERLFLVF